MAECAKCIKPVTSNDEYVRCGFCNSYNHFNCTSLDKTALKEIKKEHSACFYKCGICRSANLPATMKQLAQHMNKIHQNIFEEVKKANDELRKEMEKNLSVINEKLDKCDKIQTKVDEKCEIIERGVKSVEEAQKDHSWTEVVKKQPKRKSPVVIIKPKDGDQKRDDTRSSIKKAINPANFVIKGMKNASKGAIVIQCDDDENCEKLLTEAEQKLGDKYNVQKPRKLLPRVKMLKVDDPIDDDEALIKELKQKNPFIENDAIEIIKREQVKRNGQNLKGCFNIVLQLDGVAYNKVMENGKLYLGWNVCRVVDNIYIRRCYKCLGFNHNGAECRNKAVCGNCGSEDHQKKDCTSTDIRCANCAKANTRLRMQLSTDHNIWSSECPVYKNKLSVSKRGIQYLD